MEEALIKGILIFLGSAWVKDPWVRLFGIAKKSWNSDRKVANKTNHTESPVRSGRSLRSDLKEIPIYSMDLTMRAETSNYSIPLIENLCVF